MKVFGPSILFVCFILGACGQAEVATSAPFAPALAEDNLVGNVRKVVTEPLILGGKPTTKGSFFLIEVYDPEGYSMRVGYARDVGGTMVEQSSFARTLDKTGRLLKTTVDDKIVNYRYETFESIVRAVPVDANGKAMEAETYFEQRAVGGNLSVTELTQADGITSVRTYSPQGELLERVLTDPYSGTKSETTFAGGRTQSAKSTKATAGKSPQVVVSKYVYGEGRLPQQILRYENETLTATEDYEYQLDAAGNWTEYTMYLTEPGKGRVLSAREKRVIEYYP